MRFTLFLLILFLFSSCATMFLNKDQQINVSSDIENAKVKVKDEIYDLPAEIYVMRSKEDIYITLLTDTLERGYSLKPSANPTFLYMNALGSSLSPIMYGIDLTNPKRFHYRKDVMLLANDTAFVIRTQGSQVLYNYFVKNYETKKGELNLTFSLPWANNFYFQPIGEPSKSQTGFWGISAGLEYYYKDKRYLSFIGTAAIDNSVPVPAAVDIYGVHERITSTYVSATDNFRYRRFSWGYGLNVSKNTWRGNCFRGGYSPPLGEELIKKSNYSIGYILDLYHQVGKGFYVGLIYRPSLINVSPKVMFMYEHLISLDLKWKLNLTK